MKILHFIRSVSEIYGTYTYLQKMKDGMNKFDISQSYLCYETFDQNKKNLFSQRVPSLNQIDIEEYMKTENPDIIHFHDVFSHYLINNDMKYKKFYELSKKKVRVRTFHDYSSIVCPNYLKYQEGIFCEKPVTENCVRKNCISEKLFNEYQSYIEEQKSYDGAFYFSENVKKVMQIVGFNNDKIYNIPPLIKEPPQFAEGKTNNILFIGRISSEKGLSYLLQAVALLKTDNWQLYIVGADNVQYLKYLIKLANDLKINNRIKFSGYISNEKLEPFFLDAKIMAFPSTCRETYGFSGAEAVSYGLPLVTFDIQGINNWMIDGYTGISVPNFNVHALASAIDLLFTNKNVYTDYQINCREWSRKLNYEAQIETIRDIYYSIYYKKQ